MTDPDIGKDGAPETSTDGATNATKTAAKPKKRSHLFFQPNWAVMCVGFLAVCVKTALDGRFGFSTALGGHSGGVIVSLAVWVMQSQAHLARVQALGCGTLAMVARRGKKAAGRVSSNVALPDMLQTLALHVESVDVQANCMAVLSHVMLQPDEAEVREIVTHSSTILADHIDSEQVQGNACAVLRKLLEVAEGVSSLLLQDGMDAQVVGALKRHSKIESVVGFCTPLLTLMLKENQTQRVNISTRVDAAEALAGVLESHAGVLASSRLALQGLAVVGGSAETNAAMISLGTPVNVLRAMSFFPTEVQLQRMSLALLWMLVVESPKATRSDLLAANATDVVAGVMKAAAHDQGVQKYGGAVLQALRAAEKRKEAA